MYGLIGRMIAAPGRRDDLVAILCAEVGPMPGCRSYVVARCTTNPDGVWITEVWDDAASHRASLQLPGVQATIARARPLIVGFDSRFETEPAGGIGLA